MRGSPTLLALLVLLLLLLVMLVLLLVVLAAVVGLLLLALLLVMLVAAVGPMLLVVVPLVLLPLLVLVVVLGFQAGRWRWSVRARAPYLRVRRMCIVEGGGWEGGVRCVIACWHACGGWQVLPPPSPKAPDPRHFTP